MAVVRAGAAAGAAATGGRPPAAAADPPPPPGGPRPPPGRLAVVARAKRLRAIVATRTLASGAFRITLKPTRRAARVLRRKKRLKVKLTLSFAPTGAAAATGTRT